jgi:5-methylthioribose kinase
VWNPCFDVTPGTLIEAIITEKGLVPKQPAAAAAAAAAAAGGAKGTPSSNNSSSSSSHDVRGFMQQLGLWSATAGVAASVHGATPAAAAAAANGTTAPTAAPTTTTSSTAGPKALDAAGVVAYLLAHPHLADHVGPPATASSWTVDEVGDGNINFVFIVKGPSGGLCLKQSLPFVRCVGESWPLSTDRCRIEAEALRLTGQLCPAHVPAVYHYDAKTALIAMQYLAPPAKIMRHGIVAGEVFPAAPAHIGEFLASTLFHTSALALSSAAFKQQVLDYVNPDLCKLTEGVVFCEPFYEAPHNRWVWEGGGGRREGRRMGGGRQQCVLMRCVCVGVFGKAVRQADRAVMCGCVNKMDDCEIEDNTDTLHIDCRVTYPLDIPTSVVQSRCVLLVSASPHSF